MMSEANNKMEYFKEAFESLESVVDALEAEPYKTTDKVYKALDEITSRISYIKSLNLF